MYLLMLLGVKNVYDLTSLIKRNILNFIRNKMTVFFSFLSVIIFLALYILFIGKQFTNEQGLAFLEPEFKLYLTAGIMLGGLFVLSTISLSFGMMGNFITDLSQKKINGFLVTPVKRYKILLSYYIATIIVTTILSLFMWVIAYLYVGIFSGYWYSFGTVIYVSLIIIFFTFISSAIMIFITTLLKSNGSFGALLGILVPVIGFASGIYLPLFMLGDTMTKVASLNPFTHMTIILKNILLKEPYKILAPRITSSAIEMNDIVFGTKQIGLFGNNISMPVIMIITIFLAFFLLFISYRKIVKRIGEC